MNQLSWFLYFADIASNLQIFLSVLIFCTMVPAGVICIASAEDDDDNTRRRLLRSAAFFAVLALLMGVILVLLPSKDTMYAIAASEIGERVLQSETGTLATKALNAWLRKQID